MRLVQFNVENLFINLEKKSTHLDPTRMTEKEWQSSSASIYENKPLHKVKQLAQIIDQLNPDVLALCEVGGLESLDNFNFYFLQNRYACFLIEGNSDRGIDVGYLVRKELEPRATLKTYREREFVSGTGQKIFFARDVAELRLNNSFGALQAIVLLLHLKSKWDREGDDPQGSYRREAEFKTLLQIQKELAGQVAADIPIVLTGDFNGIIYPPEQEAEFAQILETNYKDTLEFSSVLPEHRFTQVQVSPYQQPKKVQLDYILLPETHQALVQSSFVFRFQDEFGMELPVPSTMTAKGEMPSDHYPVVCDLALKD